MLANQRDNSAARAVSDLDNTLSSLLRSSIKGAHNLTLVQTKIVGVLNDVILPNASHLGFVSGILSSDGLEFRAQNLRKLQEYTNILRKEIPFPLFSAGDFYDEDFFNRFDHINNPKRWDKFWKYIFVNGKVTDLFMTPRWEKSEGARYEFELGKWMGITIHMVEDKIEPLLISNSR